MSNDNTGTFAWHDLTVPKTEEVRDFYVAVIGWESSAQSMGDYDDYSMNVPLAGETVAGICHPLGANAELPPVWLVYINVEDVEQSAAKCVELGGEVLIGPKEMGGGQFAVIKDPAGAVCALWRGPE